MHVFVIHVFLSGDLGTSGKRLDEEQDLFSRKGRELEGGDLLLFIEIKAVQNSVGKRGHD